MRSGCRNRSARWSLIGRRDAPGRRLGIPPLRAALVHSAAQIGTFLGSSPRDGFKQLDLNLLVALDALLAERNITEAGRRFILMQSAMERGARPAAGVLRRRAPRAGRSAQMTPTPLGESLAGPVREILLQIKATINTRPVGGRPDIQLDRQRTIKVKVIRTLFRSNSQSGGTYAWFFANRLASKSLASHRFELRHPSVYLEVLS